MFQKLFLILFLFFIASCSQSANDQAHQEQKLSIPPPVQAPISVTGAKPVNSDFINVSGTAVKEKKFKMNNEE